MAYSIEQREEQKLMIRSLLAKNPMLSMRRVMNALANAEKPIVLSLPYVMELVREVRTDRVQAIQEETREDIYSEMKDVVDYVNRELRNIATEEKIVSTNTKNSAEARIFGQGNRIKAMNSIVDNLIKLVNLKMDLGIVERKVGTMDINIISAMSALKKIRNGDFKTNLVDLIPVTPELAGGSTESKS